MPKINGEQAPYLNRFCPGGRNGYGNETLIRGRPGPVQFLDLATQGREWPSLIESDVKLQHHDSLGIRCLCLLVLVYDKSVLGFT